jgi:pimeloyl-ACP methyl ester carboxylesterase
MAGVRITLIAVLALLLLPGSASALGWHKCPGADTTGVPQCATLPVPLDRAGAVGGTVPLKVARLDDSDVIAPTLVYLSGGPGGAGIEEMLAVMPLVPVLGERYHVVGFDQRGTGGSDLLRCPALERDPRLRSVSAGEDCSGSRAASTRPPTRSRISRRCGSLSAWTG